LDDELLPLHRKYLQWARLRRRRQPLSRARPYLLPKALQHRNQALNPEAVEFRPAHAGKVAVVDAGYLLGLAGA
jgi:hypothetical protein